MDLEEIGAPTRLEVAWETIPATGTGSSNCEEVHDDDGKVSYEPSVTVSWRDAAGVRRTTIEHLNPELSYIDITLWTDLETGDQVHGNLDDLLLLRDGTRFTATSTTCCSCATGPGSRGGSTGTWSETETIRTSSSSPR